jgi:hypothetical protein
MRAEIVRRVGFYGTLCGVILSALIYCGSTSPVFAQDPQRRAGLPWDWSHEHLVFGKTDDPAVKAILKKDIRAYHQRLRRNGTAARRAALLDSTLAGSAEGAQLASGAGKQSGKATGVSRWGRPNTDPLIRARLCIPLNTPSISMPRQTATRTMSHSPPGPWARRPPT